MPSFSIESAESLLAAARARTGLTDFGEDSFREGLERLVWSLREEARLSELGRVALPQLIVNLLSQRLQVEDWYRRHPEIDDERIDRPLIGLGLPRTGSTALAFLLAEDPNARSLRRWEAANPCPPPSTVYGPDPRIAQSADEVALQHQLMPRLASLVPSTATGPHECQDLMGLSFHAHYFQAFAHMPSYSSWLRDADLTSTYAYEKRVLKLLQWGSPAKPWRLKCPSHLLWLDALDRVFPDARFVMTHREPSEVILSVADLYAEVSRPMNEAIDLRYLGRLNVDDWTTAIERLLAFRARSTGDRFYDMAFRDMQRDPIGEVTELYDWLGEPVTEEFAAGMRRWWAENAAERKENVHPEAEAFGLDPGEVRERFRDYSARMTKWTEKERAR